MLNPRQKKSVPPAQRRRRSAAANFRDPPWPQGRRRRRRNRSPAGRTGAGPPGNRWHWHRCRHRRWCRCCGRRRSDQFEEPVQCFPVTDRCQQSRGRGRRCRRRRQHLAKPLRCLPVPVRVRIICSCSICRLQRQPRRRRRRRSRSGRRRRRHHRRNGSAGGRRRRRPAPAVELAGPEARTRNPTNRHPCFKQERRTKDDQERPLEPLEHLSPNGNRHSSWSLLWPYAIYDLLRYGGPRGLVTGYGFILGCGVTGWGGFVCFDDPVRSGGPGLMPGLSHTWPGLRFDLSSTWVEGGGR
jgi:hypothetical protein